MDESERPSTHQGPAGSSGMPQWEYRVVHINVESGRPPQPSTPEQASAHLHGALSPGFLAREFPEHYAEDRERGRRGHPAEQLEHHLNQLGKQGWEMSTSAQVGPLLMFVFKRPLRPLPRLLAPARSAGPLTQSGPGSNPHPPNGSVSQTEADSPTDTAAESP